MIQVDSKVRSISGIRTGFAGVVKSVSESGTHAKVLWETEDSSTVKIESLSEIKSRSKKESVTTTGEPQSPGIIEQILAHHKAGKSNKEIVKLGFNKSTVYRQVGEFKKKNTSSNTK